MHDEFVVGLSVHERRASGERRIRNERRTWSRRADERRTGFALVSIERRVSGDRRTTARRVAERRSEADRRIATAMRSVA